MVRDDQNFAPKSPSCSSRRVVASARRVRPPAWPFRWPRSLDQSRDRAKAKGRSCLVRASRDDHHVERGGEVGDTVKPDLTYSWWRPSSTSRRALIAVVAAAAATGLIVLAAQAGTPNPVKTFERQHPQPVPQQSSQLSTLAGNPSDVSVSSGPNRFSRSGSAEPVREAGFRWDRDPVRTRGSRSRPRAWSSGLPERQLG